MNIWLVDPPKQKYIPVPGDIVYDAFGYYMLVIINTPHSVQYQWLCLNDSTLLQDTYESLELLMSKSDIWLNKIKFIQGKDVILNYLEVK